MKRDNTKELYDQSKLRRALMVAFGKHHASLETINELIVQLENERSGSKEITSEQL
jgi:transcriptional regulator NrdR family protein